MQNIKPTPITAHWYVQEQKTEDEEALEDNRQHIQKLKIPNSHHTNQII